MAEVNTAEVEAKADAAFAAGFGDTPPAPVAMVVADEPVVEQPKPDAAVAPAPVPEKPQYIRVTKQDWDNAKASLGKVPAMESALAKLTGSMPKAEQLVQQVLEKVQASTPAGQAVEVTDDDVAEIVADFPDLGGGIKKALQKVAGKLRGTGGPAPAALDEGAVTKTVETVLAARELQALKKAHPTWSEIVGAVNVSAGDAIPADNPFRTWLATQPAEYQEEINNTDSAAEIRSAIDRFLAVQTKSPSSASPSPKPDKAAARRAVIEDAVTPRADGNPPPLNAPLSAEDAFGDAFKKAKRH